MRTLGRPRVGTLASMIGRAAIDNFLPVVLGFGTCVGYWRSNYITLVAGVVSSWTDLTGLGHHLAQGTAANRPTPQTDAINGHDGIRCDGSNDFLTVAFALNQPATLFQLVKCVTIGVAVTNDWLVDGGVLGTCLILQDSSPLFTVSAGAGLTSATRQADNVYAYWISKFAGASSVHRANGAQLLSGNASTNNPGGLSIGASQSGLRPSNTEWAELAQYSVATSAAVDARLEAYARAEYAR